MTTVIRGPGGKPLPMTPETIAAADTEHAHQCAIFQWIALNASKHGLRGEKMRLLFAVPNGGDRRPSVAASMKAEGVKAGIPDMCLPVSCRYDDEQGFSEVRYHGLWVELKHPKYALRQIKKTVTIGSGQQLELTCYGGCSDKQDEWHTRLRLEGYAVAVCYSWENAVCAIMSYLFGTLEMPGEEHPAYVVGLRVPA